MQASKYSQKLLLIALRIWPIIKVIRATQAAFMRGHHNLEGVVVMHETIHEIHRKKMHVVLFKIDFKKTCDKVEWPFLQHVLCMKGFDPKLCEWVKDFMQSGLKCCNQRE
jgi:hypothetical protein